MQDAPDPSGQPHQLSSASSYANLQYLFTKQDLKMNTPPSLTMNGPPKANRNRRKSSQPGEQHTKHRRTRSGCYTCRSRRVKCDETHPICERCRKGGRDCVYPETTTSSKASSKANSAPVQQSPDSSSDEYDDATDVDRLGVIPDEDESLFEIDPKAPSRVRIRRSTTSLSTTQNSTTRNSSETPSLGHDKGISPSSTEDSAAYSAYHSSTSSRLGLKSSLLSTGHEGKPDWSHLPQDLQYYLLYFYDNVTFLHYSLKCASPTFHRTTFLEAALRNESLLYAVVGFSAFQRTLHNPDGKMQDFLQYYNKAVSLLLKSLKRGEKRSIGTILAILQLATIEEYLGDWINLLGHQKAAYEILTELYTPQTVMQTEMTRVILGWYMRFDVFAGLMGGFETVLSREWFSYAEDFYYQQGIRDPVNLNWKIEHCFAQVRLVAMDMSLLFARMGRGELSQDQFMAENEAIARRLADWQLKMDPALRDSRYLVTEFPNARPLDPNDIVDPYIPGTIYSGPLWMMNLCTIDWYSIDLMHRYQTALTLRTQPSAELGMKAYATCQLFEAIEYWPDSPKGTILACQASLGIACLFLPRDQKHSMWARRKLAAIECEGYIYPYTFRTKMSDLFRDRSCMHWWLPNDENYPPIIRSIRKFVEERTTAPKDRENDLSTDLRDMKAIFANLDLGDGTSTVMDGMDSGKGITGSTAGATGQEWDASSSGATRGDVYGLGFSGGQGFWGEGQGGGAYGIPRPGGVP
ncbi:hypothetical protein F5884DRAFT_679658 [Xylogone sp. PMI_703]|nr:hypothetical protein F5884DRAFT_679658 [Xylogone sp. PMI_703]